MHPRDDLATGASSFVLANPGVSYIVYCSGEAGEIGIKHLRPGDYQLLWIDCESGNRIQNEVEVTSGATSWPKPPGFGEHCAVWIARSQKLDDE